MHLKPCDIPLDFLRSILHYSKKTGEFRWKKKPNSPLWIQRRDAGKAAGSAPKKSGYITIFVGGKNYYAHRLAWYYVTGSWPVNQIDHKNLNRSDNRFSNLREASHGDNQHNTRRKKKTGLKGTTRLPSGKWRGQIMADKKWMHLGCFDTEAEAHEAYKSAAADHHKEFARSE